MEIKSYIKHIQQQPIQPPPIEQKRITLDLTFEEFALVLASVGKCDNDSRDSYLKHNGTLEYCSVHRRMPYEVYNEMRKHAIAAGIIR